MALTLYWAVYPDATADYANNSTDAAKLAAGQDSTGASLPAGSYGSQAYTAAGVIDASSAASGLTAGTVYRIAWTIGDAGVYGGGTSTYVVVSGVVTTAFGSTNLTVADALHAHAANNVVLTSATAITIADALHAHAADNVVLTSQTAITIAEAAHAHTVDGLTLSISGADTLAIADSTHAHTADALALTSASSLAIADATHAHTVDGLTLTAQSVLAIQDALHAHAADNLTLTADNSTPLLIAEALHAHTSDGLSITVDAWLVVADSLHAHRADNVSISLPGQVASEASSTFQVLADYNVFFVAAYDRTFIVPRE